jgi:hypothetical protein
VLPAVAIVQYAGTAYYNFPRAGVRRIQCDVSPDWRPLVADLRAQNAEAGDTALRILRRLRFVWTVERGSTTILHNDVAVQNAQMRVAVKQIVDGTMQTLTGFTNTWKIFTFGAAMPQPQNGSELQIHPQVIRADGRLLVNSYDATFASETNETTALRASIGYQVVRGVKVPAQVDIEGDSSGNAFAVRAAFSGCTVN